MEEKNNICGEECEVFSRIVGYYRPVSNYNPGMKASYNDRKMFKIDYEPKNN